MAATAVAHRLIDLCALAVHPRMHTWLHLCMHGCTSLHACRFITGDTLVVDGAAWMWKPQLVPREAVSKVSRGVESKSRAVGTAAAPRSKM